MGIMCKEDVFCSCGGEDILSWKLLLGKSNSLQHNILMFVILCNILFHTSTLVSSQMTSNTSRVDAITALLAAPASTRPRSYLVFHRGSTSSELFSSASADSYHLWRYLLAALRGSQDGCISGVFSLMSEIKLYAWQSVPKWIPFATCRYIWGTLIIHLMPFKHGTGLPLVVNSLWAHVCVCCVWYLCLYATVSLPVWVTYRRKQDLQIMYICPALLQNMTHRINRSICFKFFSISKLSVSLYYLHQGVLFVSLSVSSKRV